MTEDYDAQHDEARRGEFGWLSLAVERLGVNLAGARVLEIGASSNSACAKLGGTGFNLTFACRNTVGEDLVAGAANRGVSVTLCDVDPNSHKFLDALGDQKFDVVVALRLFDREYDPSVALRNAFHLLRSGGWLLMDSRNGGASRNVMREPYTGVLGLSLLPPDHWGRFGQDRARAFYRSWPMLEGSLVGAGFGDLVHLGELLDPSKSEARRRVEGDLIRIRRGLVPSRFQGTLQFKPVRLACLRYIEYATEFLQNASWDDIDHLYRQPVWFIAAQRH